MDNYYLERAIDAASYTAYVGITGLVIGYIAACLKAHDQYDNDTMPVELEMFLMESDRFSQDYFERCARTE